MSVPMRVLVIMAMFMRRTAMRPIAMRMIVMLMARIASAMRVVVFMFHQLRIPLMLECLHPP
jgi:hypothetical protein